MSSTTKAILNAPLTGLLVSTSKSQNRFWQDQLTLTASPVSD